jgi:hypothetical protein
MEYLVVDYSSSTPSKSSSGLVITRVSFHEPSKVGEWTAYRIDPYPFQHRLDEKHPSSVCPRWTLRKSKSLFANLYGGTRRWCVGQLEGSTVFAVPEFTSAAIVALWLLSSSPV